MTRGNELLQLMGEMEGFKEELCLAYGRAIAFQAVACLLVDVISKNPETKDAINAIDYSSKNFNLILNAAVDETGSVRDLISENATATQKGYDPVLRDLRNYAEQPDRTNNKVSSFLNGIKTS